MSHSYPSDIDREQFNKIKPILESGRKKTRPRTVDLYDVICGISYVLKSGCQWRMLPGFCYFAYELDFCKFKNLMKFDKIRV